jgi:Protein CHAPERONE-LIKE PROTEIN OF POR1-like
MIERTQQQSVPKTVAAAALLLLVVTASTTAVWGFVPTSPLPSRGRSAHSTPLYTTSLQAAPIPNPFQKLPWNVEREERRKARKLRLERSALHRELGIAEDATYEEIVAATDALIARAEGDIKRKIQIEVAKDKILQIRLNERLAGLTDITTEAKAQSSFETSG